MEEISAELDLGKGLDEYEFSIERSENPPILHIPGDHRGPDLRFPRRPEQEKWLNSQERFMKPYWYCQWKFHDLTPCLAFVDYLVKK